MTLDEMIERLEEIREEVGGSVAIRGAFQPNYPLVTGVDAITTYVSDDSDKAGVYIALGDGRNYGSSDMWDDDFVYVNEQDDEDEDED